MQRILFDVERIVAFHPLMTAEEKMELAAWENAYVTGDDRYCTSQWPGWNAVIERLSQ
jgi:hypothetical protein